MPAARDRLAGHEPIGVGVTRLRDEMRRRDHLGGTRDAFEAVAVMRHRLARAPEVVDASDESLLPR